MSDIINHEDDELEDNDDGSTDNHQPETDTYTAFSEVFELIIEVVGEEDGDLGDFRGELEYIADMIVETVIDIESKRSKTYQSVDAIIPDLAAIYTHQLILIIILEVF